MSLLTCWQKKQVINICDGRCLGSIRDLEIDANTGQIVAIIVPNRVGFLGLLGCNRDYCIPWCEIRKIGDDVIMVDAGDGTLLKNN